MMVVAIVSGFRRPRVGARAEFARFIHRPGRRLGCTRIDWIAPGCFGPLPGPGLRSEICGDAVDLRPPLPMPEPCAFVFVFVPLMVVVVVRLRMLSCSFGCCPRLVDWVRAQSDRRIAGPSNLD